MATAVGLNFTEVGEGLPVVLLHGFPLDRNIWLHQWELGDQVRLIAPDLRGHGKSPATEDVYEMDLLAQDIFALLDSLNVERAAFLGHSMGGYIALAAFKRAPDRVSALGMICSQAGADTEEARKGRLQTAEKVAKEGSQVMADAMLPKLFSPKLATDSPIREQVKQIILSTDPVGIAGSLRGMAARPDSTSLLSKINVPALVLTGDQDQIIPAEKAQAMVKALPKAKLSVIENSGHMPMLEQPEGLTAALREFLKTVK